MQLNRSVLLAEVRRLASISKPTLSQKIMLDLLAVIERGRQIGIDVEPYFEALQICHAEWTRETIGPPPAFQTNPESGKSSE